MNFWPMLATLNFEELPKFVILSNSCEKENLYSDMRINWWVSLKGQVTQAGLLFFFLFLFLYSSFFIVFIFLGSWGSREFSQINRSNVQAHVKARVFEFRSSLQAKPFVFGRPVQHNVLTFYSRNLTLCLTQWRLINSHGKL